MTTVQKSIRLPIEAVKEIEALASGTGKDFSGIARDLLVEAIKMRRCPGVTFADGPTGYLGIYCNVQGIRRELR